MARTGRPDARAAQGSACLRFPPAQAVSKKATKSAARKKAIGKKPPLVEQPHGGALYRAGVPGNRGGGRPPSAVRRLARLEFEKRIPTLAELADSKTERTRDRIRAIDVLGKYGLGQARGLDEEEFEAVVLELAGAVQRRLVGALPPAQADAVLAQLFEDWKEILRARRTGAAD